MSTGDQKQVVHYLLTQMTATLLAKSPVKDKLQQAAEMHQNRLRAKFSEDEYAPILAMRDIIDELIKKLVACNDVDALAQTYEYLKALNKGEVLIADSDPVTGDISQYVANT